MTTTNVHMLPKHQDRRNYILQGSIIPIAICMIAFARSAFYHLTLLPAKCRSFGWYLSCLLPAKCRSFGWYLSATGDFQCNYTPLNLHATAALLWLAIFDIQAGLLLAGKLLWHRAIGKLGLVGAFWNAVGMFWLAYQDTIKPMDKKTDHPPAFTPLLFVVAFNLIYVSCSRPTAS
jgi:hypothetical protein